MKTAFELLCSVALLATSCGGGKEVAPLSHEMGYPVLANLAGVRGSVIANLAVSEGAVVEVKLQSGPVILAEYVKGVTQSSWKFPAQFSGEYQLECEFILDDSPERNPPQVGFNSITHKITIRAGKIQMNPEDSPPTKV